MLKWLLGACLHFFTPGDLRKSILSNPASFLGSTAEGSSNPMQTSTALSVPLNLNIWLSLSLSTFHC